MIKPCKFTGRCVKDVLRYHNVGLGDRLTSSQFLYIRRNSINKVCLSKFVLGFRESRVDVKREES